VEVVNPVYRTIDSAVRKLAGKLTRKGKEFVAFILEGEIAPQNVEEYLQKKADLQEEIGSLEKDVERLKAERKKTKKHIQFGELTEKDRFRRLSVQSKYLIDTIKMIAYRAETSMVNIAREKMNHKDEARSLLRAICKSDADIIPNYEAGVLTVRLHQLANRSSGETMLHLCDELNATETVFPGTELRLIYELVTWQNPRGQEFRGSRPRKWWS